MFMSDKTKLRFFHKLFQIASAHVFLRSTQLISTTGRARRHYALSCEMSRRHQASSPNMIYRYTLLAVALLVLLPAGWAFRVDDPRTFTKRTHSIPRRQLVLLNIAPQQLGEFEILSSVAAKETRKVALLDFLKDGQEPIPFESAWDMQKQILAAHVDRLLTTTTEETSETNQFIESATASLDESSLTTGKDTIIFLQHHPVYTLGTGSDEKFITSGGGDVPVVRMDRGGEVTYHGPGQLTAYPILDLRGYKQDIHWYIRALEEAVIVALSRYGLQAERQDGITGVWVNNCKVAAVGIKCRKWITMHGLAVNVEEEALRNFDGIVPCGLENRQVGCVNQFLSKSITISEFSETLKEALEDVFQIELLHHQTTSTYPRTD